MQEIIQNFADENHIDIVRVVNITSLSLEENKTDELADELATIIQEKGYKAISQSEKGIDFRGEYDEKTKSSTLPHKKIATMSGLGWIGKNNLLVTEKYGAAISMSKFVQRTQYMEKSGKQV